MERVEIFGRAYVSHDSFTFGDYGGAGSVGLANIRVIRETFEDAPEMSYRDLENLSQFPQHADDDLVSLFKSDNPPKAFICSGSYSSETAYLLEDDEQTEDLISAVSDYPSLSDDEVTKVEMEWEEEAWESWLKSDLIREAFDDDDEQDQVSELDDDTLFECYRDAMEERNEYPTPEYNGVHVDIKRIASTFAGIVRDRMATV